MKSLLYSFLGGALVGCALAILFEVERLVEQISAQIEQ